MKSMKTAADVQRHIEQFMSWMLDRPHMYAHNPESLEDQLCVLDNLRLEIQSPGSRDDFDHGYGAYLRSKGYDAASFCTRNRPDSPQTMSTDDKKLFKKLARSWTNYFQSEYALKRPKRR